MRSLIRTNGRWLAVSLAGALGLFFWAMGAAGADTDPFVSFTHNWRDDPIWRDGKAETAVYDATRIIYGKTRRYTARLYANKEHASSESKTKSATGKGREAFKHHLREDIPTENYTYHYSTMCYVGTSDLKSLKIDMGSQEDCGASFKQFVNHAGTCQWHSFTYFPNEGHTSGSFRPPKNFAFQDALSLVLRGYPFDRPRTIDLLLLLDQTRNRQTPSEPVSARVEYVGLETVSLPVGTVQAHHLVVKHTTRAEGHRPESSYDYWFAAESAPPWLHVMVQYQAADEITYKLREHKRWAYWRR